MFCKKCGTEQRDGQKFCPKCGEPFLDENGKPYLKGIKKDIQEAKLKMASKVDELTQQGKKLVEEKVQPQFDETIEDLKKVNWDEKKKNASSYVIDFIKNPSKIGLITKVLVCFFVVWFFAKMGFAISVLWYVIIAAIIYIVFRGIPHIKMDILKKQFLSTGLCIILMIITGIGASKNDSNGGFMLSGSSPQEEFMESFDNPSTAYSVRIDLRYNSNSMRWVEVPIGEGSLSDSYVWTLLFFPESESKKMGRATIEPWCLDRKGWARGYTNTYKYEIRDGVIELYNGYSLPSALRNVRRVDDRRFLIEKGDDGIQLRGEFKDAERVFKQTQYQDVEHRDQHYFEY